MQFPPHLLLIWRPGLMEVRSRIPDRLWNTGPQI
nr:MAG TPA: hypothetical protein [Caudoviricetes sp.]